jgi:hypothetical protein
MRQLDRIVGAGEFGRVEVCEGYQQRSLTVG